ncbi:hypothetical protein K443DRAFT_321723 [Laccaria amethystina LaAM-08-1]|uniref:Uncharacterized protein n=1 Tax=Laccaria amethystina LaAM-08-1 TaxID=1095629 RepID=A0A0C9WU62_9AGAR|nr:hypothetical protein K443DRAFT_321723 [Laccaria amethystina LaAM-08-1]
MTRCSQSSSLFLTITNTFNEYKRPLLSQLYTPTSPCYCLSLPFPFRSGSKTKSTRPRSTCSRSERHPRR